MLRCTSPALNAHASTSTADRLLSGRLDPDDAPPSYADVARRPPAAALGDPGGRGCCPHLDRPPDHHDSRPTPLPPPLARRPSRVRSPPGAPPAGARSPARRPAARGSPPAGSPAAPRRPPPARPPHRQRQHGGEPELDAPVAAAPVAFAPVALAGTPVGCRSMGSLSSCICRLLQLGRPSGGAVYRLAPERPLRGRPAAFPSWSRSRGPGFYHFSTAPPFMSHSWSVAHDAAAPAQGLSVSSAHSNPIPNSTARATQINRSRRLTSAEDLVELGRRPAFVHLQRMHINPQGQRAAVGVAELGGDVRTPAPRPPPGTTPPNAATYGDARPGRPARRVRVRN